MQAFIFFTQPKHQATTANEWLLLSGPVKKDISLTTTLITSQNFLVVLLFLVMKVSCFLLLVQVCAPKFSFKRLCVRHAAAGANECASLVQNGSECCFRSDVASWIRGEMSSGSQVREEDLTQRALPPDDLHVQGPSQA